MNTSNTSIDLSKGSVGKLLFSMALPCIAAQIINVLYNLVDRMYIGHIEGTGGMALTGVGVTFPIIMAVSAFASLVCMGGAPRAAIFLGKKDRDMAEKILNQCFALLIVTAIVLMAVVWLAGKPMLTMFGASDATIGYAWNYLSIYNCGTLFVMTALGMNAFINTQGYTKWGMISVGIGAVLNICLDPLFIFVFGMAERGAAVATVLSQMCSAIFCIWFLSSKKTFLKLKPSMMKISAAVLGPCVMLGLSPFVMQITESLITVCFNSSLQSYGGDIAVGAMTILASVMQFSLLPLQGLTQGAQPIISYNYGAHCYDRIKKCFKILLISCLIYSFTLWFTCEFFPWIWAGMFTKEAELIAYTDKVMRIYMFSQCLFGAQIACQQTFLALGNAKTSLFLALFRKIICLIPLIYLLPLFVSSNADKALAVYTAEPIADFLAVTTTCILFAKFYKTQLDHTKNPDPANT